MKSSKMLIVLTVSSLLLLVLLIRFEPNVRLFFSQSSVAPYHFAISPLPDLQILIDDLEKRMKRDPTSGLDRAALASVYVSKAKTTGDETLYDKASDLAKESLKLLPVSNTAAKMVLAHIAAARHRFAESIQLCEEVLKEKGGAEVFASLATVYLAQGKLSEAMLYAERLVQDHPSLFTYGLRALVLQASGRDDEAEFDYRHGIVLEDVGETLESARERTLYARFLLKFGRFSEAKTLLKEALRIFPGMPLALDQLGELELLRKNYKGAADYFMQAFTGSRQIIYFHHYGKAKLLAGESANAEKVFEEVEKNLRAELARNSYGHRAELAQLLLDENKKEKVGEAVSLVKEELKTRQSAEILKVLALAYERVENWAEGKRVVDKILSLGLRDPAVYQLAATFAERLGNKERADLYLAMAKKMW